MLAEPIESGGGKRRLIAGFAVLALFGAVSFYGWGRRGGAGELPTVAEVPAAAKPAAPTPTVSRVSVALQATPAEAKLYLDDQPLPANPTTKLILADGKAHVLRAEAPGFAKATSEFSPTEDTTVALTLTPVEHAAHTTSDAPASAAHRYPVRAGRPVVAGAPAAAPATAAPVAAAPASLPRPRSPTATIPSSSTRTAFVAFDRSAVRHSSSVP